MNDTPPPPGWKLHDWIAALEKEGDPSCKHNWKPKRKHFFFADFVECNFCGRFKVITR